ncbi:MAG: glycosyltransferase [Streptomycetales bacterium]
MTARPTARPTVRLAAGTAEALRPSRPGRRIRVLHITQDPGSLHLLAGQPGYLRRRGVDYAVVCPPSLALDRFAEAELVPAYPVPMRPGFDPVRDSAAVVRLARIMRRLRPHLVHGHTPKGGLLAVAAGRAFRVPTVFHLHDLYSATAQGAAPVLHAAAERVSMHLADQVLVTSPSLLRLARSQGLCPANKGQVPAYGSSNGVDALERFNPDRHAATVAELRHRLGIPAGAPVVGFAGNADADTGELADLWAALRSRVPGVHLVTVTRRAAGGSWDGDTTSLVPDPRVHLVGGVDEPAPYYGLMDVLTLPDAATGIPDVVIEASAMRVPVVAARTPWIAEAVEHGSTGVLVARRDRSACVEALVAYLSDQARAREHGNGGRQRVLRRYGPTDVWESFAALYEDLTSPPVSRRQA